MAALLEAYKLVSELLLYPEQLDPREMEEWAEAVAPGLAAVAGPEPAALIRSFARDLKSITPGEYLDTLELSPRCPLYLGYWAFKNEGVDSQQRRQFMTELTDVYRHFGLDLDGKELPDFLPVVTEFLWLSLERDGGAAQRRAVAEHARRWLPEMVSCLEGAGSPYGKLLRGLQGLIEWDVSSLPEALAETETLDEGGWR